jgi:hypothetical protein
MSDVTSRVILPLLEAAREANLPVDALFEDLSFGPRELRDRSVLVAWDDYALFVSRVGRLLGRDRCIEIGHRIVLRSRVGRILGAVAGNLASGAALYNVALWFGRMLYSVTQGSLTQSQDGKGTLIQIVEIPEPYRECTEFFWGCEGAIRATPQLLGQDPASVNAEISPRRGIFFIKPPPPLTLAQKLRRWSSTRASIEAMCEELEFQQSRFEQERARRLQCEQRIQRLEALLARVDDAGDGDAGDGGQ